MPQPLAIETPELQANESIKSFQDQDALAKAYVELEGRVKSGDINVLPEDIRKDPSISKYKTVSDVAKGYIEANKLIGGIKHAPRTADEYKFTQIQNLHAGLAKGAPETQKFLAALAHSLDMDQDRADKLQQSVLGALNTSLTKQEEARTAKGKEVETALRNEWGNDYEKNKNNIENIFKRLGVEDLASAVGGNSVYLKAVHKLTSLLSEDSIGKLGEGTNSSIDVKTKEGAQKAIKEFNDKVLKEGLKHPFNDAKHQDHKKTVEEYNKLFEVAFS